jgi:hypothetical protein
VLKPRIRHDRVEPAESLESNVDGGAVPVASRQVGCEALPRSLRIRLEVDGEDIPAVLDEPLSDRPADPAGRARDERSLAQGPPRT